jgi:two-component system, OmpR family, osmolarity sensor histidine kinase EnvZ
MKRRPVSLLLRTNLVLAVSAAAIAGTAILALNYFVIEPIAEQAADDEAALLVLSAQTWVELPPAARRYFELELTESHDLIITPDVRALPPAELDMHYLALLQDKLSARTGSPVLLMQGDDLIWANVPMGGQMMQIGFAPNRRDVQPLNVGLIIIVTGAVIVFGTSLLILQRITLPLVRAAESAETFRGGEGFVPLPEEGPRELVTLARSFNTMAREIVALLTNRTTLLAGISHDLRTPLARMRLAVELLPDNVDPKLIARLERNLELMDSLIGDALMFARGAGEGPVELNLRTWLEEVVTHVDDQVSVTWQEDAADVRIRAAPGALRRVLQNLLANARQHAGGTPRILVETKGTIAIHVIDEGPGIPDEYREKVFQPFFRLDQSRSQSNGGSGLGLAIVQQLCQAHGWNIEISNACDGGTDATLGLGQRQDTQAWSARRS